MEKEFLFELKASFKPSGSQPEAIKKILKGIKNGKKFMKIAKKVSRKKPIIVLKGGITEAGSKAVSFSGHFPVPNAGRGHRR